MNPHPHRFPKISKAGANPRRTARSLYKWLRGISFRVSFTLLDIARIWDSHSFDDKKLVCRRIFKCSLVSVGFYTIRRFSMQSRLLLLCAMSIIIWSTNLLLHRECDSSSLVTFSCHWFLTWSPLEIERTEVWWKDLLRFHHRIDNILTNCIGIMIIWLSQSLK